MSVKDFVSGAIRLTCGLAGHGKGLYNATRMEAVEALTKPDGTADLGIHIEDQSSEGEVITIPAKRTGKGTSPTTVHIEGTNTFRTASKEVACLNTAKGRFVGDFNASTGDMVVKCFAEG